MLRLAGGEFTMGSPTTESERSSDEGPQHKVRLDPFYAGETPITQAVGEKLLGRNPSYFSKTGGGKDKVSCMNTSEFPLETITWFDCIELANAASQLDGRPPFYRLSNIERASDREIKKDNVERLGGDGYRLATEAEYEYFNRAGTTTPFWFGATNNGEKANVDGSVPYGTTTKGPYLQRTSKVRSYAKTCMTRRRMAGGPASRRIRW